ncbi:MAG TPA: hypothetical protein VHV08_07195 [Pirellulales bacterium]|nr:hypothetical protein [Pirellulales bacterium]
MEKSLDRKLAAIHADPSGSKEFILADAKDADMAFGIGAPGLSPEMHAGEVRMRTLAEYRENIRQIARQGLVDIMLMSASSNDALTIGEGLFEKSHVTPAARANDASDIFAVRHGGYVTEPSRPFRTASLDHIQCGHVDCAPDERARGANLGLYSITFNNRLQDDLVSLDQYRLFREEAERRGFRHFLEVFDPNAPQDLSSETTPQFLNDSIARTLAGVASAGRPVFLKIVYHGPRAMEELVAYDPHLVVGILGGGAGTTYDAFKLIAEAQKYGARAGLFGRKINSAECQLAFVEFLRRIVQGEVTPEEAVKAYHGVLDKLRIKPRRALADDMQLQTSVMSYGGRSSSSVPAGVPVKAKTHASGAKHDCGCDGPTPAACHCHETATSDATSGQPDFAGMTTAEKLAYNKAKRDRIFG